MTLYADTPARRTRQILGDVLVLLWVATWVWVGRGVFDAAGSGTSLRSAGTSMSSTVEAVALWLGLVTALVPIVIVAGLWLWVRVRFVRRATTAQRFIDSSDDLDLFALRALASQPMTALARVSADPAGDWRRRDPAIIRALATLELNDKDLRPPAERTGSWA